MTVQIIVSKDFGNSSIEEISDNLDYSILSYLKSRGWIVDNISTI